MKAKIKIFAIVWLTICFGCNPELVDNPSLAPTEEDYFSNATEFRTQLTSAYAAIYDHYHFAAPSFTFNGWVAGTWLLPGDDLTETNAARTSVELFDGTLNPTNQQVSFVFQACYKMISRANVTIEKVRTIDYSTYDGADEITMMEGEALFLRAYAYFKLFNVFGSVPIVTDRILSEEETNTPKSPAIEVLGQVIEDTKAAIEVLPEEWDPMYLGRIDKNAARGLLAKALVFRGDYEGNTADYQEALTVFNTITATLVDSYLDNFSAYTENNAESLFEVQASVPSSGNNNLSLHNDGAWRGVENMSVYRGYMMEFGGRGDFNDASSTKFLVTDKLRDSFGDDPRLSVFSNPEDGFEGKIFQKYNKPDGVNELSGFNGGSVNNERVLRYADLVLIAAEAALKTGNASQAISLINQIRTRARLWGESSGDGDGVIPADYSEGESDTNTVMQWIMNERFIELAGEGQRWWDLKRWHVAGDMNISGWDGSDANFSTNLASPVQFDVDKHLLFPIPQSEIERNSAITENNPGY
ncbi:RagB/SusD family nutrient uptake outer membrane protein [Chondrinema litorale]|uniref:RagB/SusD family nutrient uptake outer membrane protein n=1 Tax=Chondrinema litorale TaxID=2994555 RepID=UPI0025434A2C|nr:RagB/SusD family nutrient uptake outer membrane protein [Chondrinema litorale]UZR99232.1 RagB/SusD family nutrient uptake outer membrane protein [Chondrinema litorale]